MYVKIDDKSRWSLDSIYFYLTDGCNLRCRHCWISPIYDDQTSRLSRFLAPDLFDFILHQARPLGLTSVKLTGGEPLLHPRIGDILETVCRQGLHLQVETNGILASPDISAMIASCRKPSVSVSLDGADAATHEWVRGVPGSFRAAVRGIENLSHAGLRPQIIMTLMRRNHAQMEAVAVLAREMGAGSVKFNIVQPTERGLRLHEHDQTMSIGELVETGRWVEEEFAGKVGLPVHFSHPPAFSPLERLVERVARCRIHNIIGVLADGSYALCGIGASVPELCFGHASTDLMEDVWNDTPILSAIRKELPSRLGGICGRCLVRGACLGSCIAQNYYRCGDLFSGHWYCEMAYEAGLFPEERLSPPSIASSVERRAYQ